jgi:hypothetical protein
MVSPGARPWQKGEAFRQAAAQGNLVHGMETVKMTQVHGCGKRARHSRQAAAQGNLVHGMESVEMIQVLAGMPRPYSAGFAVAGG